MRNGLGRGFRAVSNRARRGREGKLRGFAPRGEGSGGEVARFRTVRGGVWGESCAVSVTARRGRGADPNVPRGDIGSARRGYLEAFGVKNLRCLTDTGLVPIRPITLLVGKNSSGKSTFLRAFPLLRQSVETARNSPVLWYDERYVDFGSLQAAANNRLSEPSVTFVLFDQDEETGDTSVRLAGYHENGALHDWPYGFLSPVAERRVSPAAE